MGQKYSTELQSNLANEFYQFCCNGNVNRVREYLPLLSYNEINYINPNTGQTSLHAACLNNHLEIVRLLLENNVCNRIIRNQQNRIAYDVSPSNEIRSLFRRSQQPNETNRFIEICPNRSSFGLITNTRSETNRPDDWVTGYFSSADAQDAQLMMALSHASPIMKLLLYAQFLNKNSVKSLLTLYSLQTPLFGTLQSNADAYTVLLYLHLDELSDLAYRGRLTYRGMIMSFDDLRAYQWAHEHAAIIETRTFQSTSKDRAVAFAFSDLPPGYNNQLSVIVRYKFTQICPTAIDIHNESHFTPEDEVLLLPFTLFRVTSIKERSSDEVLRYEITMQNIPVTPNSLWASSR
ncbi:unnamed protein product [Adineta steineri]|uniref:Mono(ADP-ribosyl)transferase n=1 Tax=Adineta steineri TaxID=433720 RepID=A0A815LD94_9BILA|nr:unnamed protein product [Adineta steineri]CAF3830088.1 unnamed protein product [Adineta steineri]